MDIIAALESGERDARVAHGLTPDHVLDMAQFPFMFSGPLLDQYEGWAVRSLAKKPGDPLVLFHAGLAALARRKYDVANAAFVAFQAASPADPLAQMRFGVELPPARLELPPVTGSYPKGPALFIGCSGDYLHDFGMPLLRSIAATAPGTPVHIHLMSPADEILRQALVMALPLSLTATTEDPSAFIASLGMEPRTYYGSARLVRFAEALETSEGPLVMMDCDGLFNGDPRLFDIPGDIALRVRAGRLHPVHQFSACVVLGRPGARPYYRRVANFVKSLMPRNAWGFDQYALFAAWLVGQPPLTLLGPDLVDISDYKPQAPIWFTAGAKKFDLLTADSEYARLYRHYISGLQ